MLAQHRKSVSASAHVLLGGWACNQVIERISGRTVTDCTIVCNLAQTPLTLMQNFIMVALKYRQFVFGQNYILRNHGNNKN